MDTLNIIANNRLWNKHGVKLAWLLALLILALILSSITWTAWSQIKLKQANYQPQTIAPIRTASKASYQVNNIVAANLFGDPTPAPVLKEAPKTTLDLTLVGVLWSSDDSIGRAIIMSGKKAPLLYSLDDDIKGAGAKVEEIRDGEVILNRNGALESLPLKKLIDPNNRIVVAYEQELVDSSNIYQGSKSTTTSPNRRTAANTVIEQQTANGETRRVRRPNFSGLDRALEKMGEL